MANVSNTVAFSKIKILNILEIKYLIFPGEVGRVSSILNRNMSTESNRVERKVVGHQLY